DHEWCEFFKSENFLVGVSLDLKRECHNGARVDSAGNGTFDKVLASLDLLREHDVNFNILCTLTDELAGYPKRVWDLIVRQDFRYVQFTPCMDGLEGCNGYGLTPRRFAEFYKDLFDRWYGDLKEGRVRSIKMFDDIANLLLFNIKTACGIDGHCMPQIIAEADGSVYPCDFYCLDEYKVGNLNEEDILTVFDKAGSSMTKEFAPPEKCRTCRFMAICGGNCKRMRKNICFADPGTDYCGYKDLLEYIGPRLYSLGKNLQ
ncbi:MAG: SPASM domain-containing protein, partial [Lachnospiraceae bacterium]|nr:SPASM domain-containing protein [Lachnospiraceae bacterium]